MSHPGNFVPYVPVSACFLAGFNPAAAISASGIEQGFHAVFDTGLEESGAAFTVAVGDFSPEAESEFPEQPMLPKSIPTERATLAMEVIHRPPADRSYRITVRPSCSPPRGRGCRPRLGLYQSPPPPAIAERDARGPDRPTGPHNLCHRRRWRVPHCETRTPQRKAKFERRDQPPRSRERPRTRRGRRSPHTEGAAAAAWNRYAWSNSPSFAPPMNACHSPGVKTSAGRV